MIYIDGTNDILGELLTSLLNARGIESTRYVSQTTELDRKKPNCYVSISQCTSQNGSNAELVEFLKRLGFKRAVLVKLGSGAFSLCSHLNGSVIEINLPIGFDSDDHVTNYFLHYAIEYIADGIVNLPCSEGPSSNILNMIKKLSTKDVTILVGGPTGTGKEVISQLIHQYSHRYDKPFIAVNCAAIPEHMLESTLFGHEKGSFTGALHQNVGLFRAASGGTILLDEISEMPFALQAKLLRVLQEKSVMPIGSSKEVPIDTRIIATTNRNMRDEVQNFRFREDLFYRLNVFPITTQSLSARKKDIVPIAAHMIAKLDKGSHQVTSIDDGALLGLLEYDWPGNVRELGNVLQRAHIICENNTIKSSDIILDVSVSAGPFNTADALAAKFNPVFSNEVKV